MNRFIRRGLHFYQQQLGEVAVLAIVLLAILFLPIGDGLNSPGWPQQWEFHHRIRLGQLNYGKPEILYFHPNGTWVPVPYLSGVFGQLQNQGQPQQAARRKPAVRVARQRPLPPDATVGLERNDPQI